jgi:hypothetical protein
MRKRLGLALLLLSTAASAGIFSSKVSDRDATNIHKVVEEQGALQADLKKFIYARVDESLQAMTLLRPR